jgi:uncharacterized membrane-anchored protein YitT (DUF2179 family)
LNRNKLIKSVIKIFISALISAFAIVNFVQGSGLLSSGLTGIALILNRLSNGVVPLGPTLLILNIPLAILAFKNVGKYFTVLSFLNVLLTSILLSIIPNTIHLDDIMLNAIVGGVLSGLGVAIALEAGASTGGTDFVALFLSVKKQVSAGKYMMYLNGAIVLLSAIFFGVEIAVYTIIMVFVSTRVIDAIHVRYQRVTLAIITTKADEVIKEMIANSVHGITVMDARGAFTNEPKKFLYTVISTYEINEVKSIVIDIDPNAFINITSSKDIIGNFISAKYE